MHKVETWNRASAAEEDGIACCIFFESAHTTSAREHTTRNVGARPRMWTACIAHVFDMLTFLSHLPSSTFFPRCRKPSKYRGTGVTVFPKYNWVVYSTTHAMRRADSHSDALCIRRKLAHKFIIARSEKATEWRAGQVLRGRAAWYVFQGSGGWM